MYNKMNKNNKEKMIETFFDYPTISFHIRKLDRVPRLNLNAIYSAIGGAKTNRGLVE